jgi:hypothetical protein
MVGGQRPLRGSREIIGQVTCCRRRKFATYNSEDGRNTSEHPTGSLGQKMERLLGTVQQQIQSLSYIFGCLNGMHW